MAIKPFLDRVAECFNRDWVDGLRPPYLRLVTMGMVGAAVKQLKRISSIEI